MEDKDLKYIVVEAQSARDLAERVTEFLNRGWMLQGSLFYVIPDRVFYQAVYNPEIPKLEPYES
jgi:hypothetical protein